METTLRNIAYDEEKKAGSETEDMIITEEIDNIMDEEEEQIIEEQHEI